MKLIIEIPDSYNLDGIRNGSIYGQLVLNAVKNGTPISDNATPCDFCRYNPPSSTDGKPCCMCPATGRSK